MARTFYAIEAGDVRMISNGYTFSAGTKGAFDAVSATWTPAQRAAYDEAVTQLNRWIAERDVLPACRAAASVLESAFGPATVREAR